MPAAYSSIGTVGTGTTSVTAGLPASLATGDGVLLAVVAKPDTATINTPAGWTLVSTVSGGGGTVGNGTGPQRAATFFREKDASWSTMPAVAVTGGTSSAAAATRWTKAGGESWDVAAATGVYGTAATTTSANTTMGSNPGITSGDMLAMFVTNQSATPTWSAQSFSSAGATIGAATERSEAVEFATSPQVGGMLATASVTAGTGSGNPVINATASAATRGTSTIVRLRGVPQPPFPVMDASSPATIKSTTGTTFTTASFTPPANSCIVVGITSDADSNAGATPTITDNTGGRFTWTRVNSSGHGGSGDTGLVALFQGVPTSPGTSPGAMTVTVTPNNNGATKPRMIRTSVYTSATVDITDPVGANSVGAFSTGTTLSASLTPETTNGGLRMMWLDWNATGVPTTTQAGVVVADSYHNAGLSTNIQLGKVTPTTTGVAETIGATLLASATDGNWLAYELRAPAVGGTTTNSTTSETTTTADSAARTLSQPRTATESTTTADASTRTVARARAAAEATTTADAASRTVARARAAGETTTTADSTAPVLTRTIARSTTETTSTSDATARAAQTFARSAGEGTTTADSAARTRSQPRTAAETTTTADTSARTVARSRTGSEATSTSDSTTPSQTGQIIRATSETTTTADQAARTTSRARTATESTTTADASTRTVARARAAAESTTTADASSGSRTGAPRIRSTAETTTTSDTSQGSTTGQIVRGTSEATSTSDSNARRTSRQRAAAETTTTSDAASRRTSRSRLQLEATSTSDLAARAIATARSTLEATTTLDSCSPAMGLPPFEIEIIRVSGRQRQVFTAGRSARSFTSTGRPPEIPPAGRARTFSWTGRPRPPITGSP